MLAGMCLIAFAWQCHTRYPLVLAGNRDEFHVRPTAAAGFDPEAPHVYGGRDLQQGGSWLLLSTRRRLAAVTNVRDPTVPRPAPRSRGALVREFATGTASAAAFAADLRPHAAEYGPFDLLLWDGAALRFASNHPQWTDTAVTPGVHTLSNASLDTPWPKTRRASAALSAWLASSAARQADAAPADAKPADTELVDIGPLLAMLADTTPAADAALPDTGVGLALERTLSPVFVSGADYGTRSSSVVLVADAHADVVERQFGPRGVVLGERRIRLPAATG